MLFTVNVINFLFFFFMVSIEKFLIRSMLLDRKVFKWMEMRSFLGFDLNISVIELF